MKTMNLDEVLAEALAAHVIGAQQHGDRVALGLGGIEAACSATETQGGEGLSITELHVGLHGGVLGDAWVDCTWAGFGETSAESITSGVHHWIEGPFQALASAFGSGSVEPLDRVISGRKCRVFASPWNVRGPSGAAAALAEALGRRPLVDRLVDAGVLPLLEPGRPLIVSLFVARYGDDETLEVKIDGIDWPLAAPALAHLPLPGGDAYASVRELAVVWPEAAPLALPTRADLERTLAGLSAADPERVRFGADHHDYALAPPLVADAVAQIEARAGVALPADYRRFVTELGARGAGPFHGLLPLDTAAQIASLSGAFPYTEKWAPAHADDAPDLRGTLALAHVGCSYFALLVVAGPARGEVWADLRAADRGLVRTHASFTDWYLEWLFALVANGPAPWAEGAERCAFPRAISNYLVEDLKRRGLPPDSHDIGPSLAALPPRAIATAADDPHYFEHGQPVDLCPSCVALARRLGLAPDRFVPGTPPKQAS